MPDILNFGTSPISCHTWNKDRTEFALSPNNEEVHVYKLSGGSWALVEVLREHEQRVTGLDWAPTSDRIVSCGADRNAYVWTRQADGSWKPMLVLLRINRAATCVKWSPLENKFAVGSGARCVSVCFFERENDWWVSKQLRKPMRSTVSSLDWHKDNVLLACGSSDFKARVFSAYIKDVDEKPAATVWGAKMPFGQLMAEFSNGGGGWVRSVSFSADGEKVAWVGHDASISVVNATKGNEMTTVKTTYLPFTSIMWAGPQTLIVAGFDCCPMAYSYSGAQLAFVGKLDEQGSGQAAQKVTAMSHFKALDKMKQNVEEHVTTLPTVHQNTISGIGEHTGNKNSLSKLSTYGVDGNIVVWNLKSLSGSMAGLKI